MYVCMYVCMYGILTWVILLLRRVSHKLYTASVEADPPKIRQESPHRGDDDYYYYY